MVRSVLVWYMTIGAGLLDHGCSFGGSSLSSVGASVVERCIVHSHKRISWLRPRQMRLGGRGSSCCHSESSKCRPCS